LSGKREQSCNYNQVIIMSKTTQLTNQPATIPDITLTLDFGGSLTKVLWCESSGKMQLLAMEPEVIAVSPEALATYTSHKMGEADPKDGAWVAIDGKYKAVGYLARSRFHANPGLNELKYERALYKTLAAIWVISQRLHFSDRFSVAVSCLLPSGEYEDRSRFATQLRTALANFTTPTGQLKVTLAHFDCKPEGGGIYLLHYRNAGKAHLLERVVAIVMIGYRNAGVLVSYRGQVEPGCTSDLGFVRLVEGVMSRTSGQSMERLIPAIVAAGTEVKLDALLHLPRSTSKEGRAEDVVRIAASIKEARELYKHALTSWLDNVLPMQELDEIVLCGGTVDYLKSDLKNHFAPLPCSIDAGVTLPPAFDTQGLGNRLMDVYGAFLVYKTEIKKVFPSYSPLNRASYEADSGLSASSSSASNPSTVEVAL